MHVSRRRLRARERFGQYRIDRHLASGGFSSVYAATDTIAGQRVALKVLNDGEDDASVLADLKREVRIAGRIEHPNVLSIRHAGMVEGRFVIVSQLAVESLGDRLSRRLGRATVLDIASQMLAGLAEAHSKRVVHCDIKPPNILLFEGGRVKIADFGLARIAARSIDASGSGTVGYMAPEQALGKPSLRSDVFSAGLILYRMMSGQVPEWPFEWPFPGAERARRNYHRDLIAFTRKAVAVDSRKRFSSCVPMRVEFDRLRRRALRETKAR